MPGSCIVGLSLRCEKDAMPSMSRASPSESHALPSPSSKGMKPMAHESSKIGAVLIALAIALLVVVAVSQSMMAFDPKPESNRVQQLEEGK